MGEAAPPARRVSASLVVPAPACLTVPRHIGPGASGRLSGGVGGCGWQSLLEDAVKDVQAKYKADRALLKETYKALPQTIPGPPAPTPRASRSPGDALRAGPGAGGVKGGWCGAMGAVEWEASRAGMGRGGH